MSLIYLGLHGEVVALDRNSGQEVWRQPIKGSDFVNLTLDGDQLIATTKGEVFCIEAATGQPRWHNQLPGMGLGLITVVSPLSPASGVAPISQKRLQDEQAAASSAAIVATT